MSYIAMISALLVGALVGWLVRFFIRRFKNYTPKGLAAVVLILLGTLVYKFFSGNRELLYLYSIGLFVGFILYSLIAWLAGAPKDGTIYKNIYQQKQTEQKRDDE
jgi:fructose-specific phosphotransferase system IIC component